jgi:transcriptional regulator GlxA family with amidase domain
MLTIGFVVPSGFQIMGLAAASAFELANATAKQRLYDIRLLSEEGGDDPEFIGNVRRDAWHDPTEDGHAHRHRLVAPGAGQPRFDQAAPEGR